MEEYNFEDKRDKIIRKKLINNEKGDIKPQPKPKEKNNEKDQNKNPICKKENVLKKPDKDKFTIYF